MLPAESLGPVSAAELVEHAAGAKQHPGIFFEVIGQNGKNPLTFVSLLSCRSLEEALKEVYF